MTKLSEAKTIGGVGSILLILGIVPSVGWILSIAGLIMILYAVKSISDTVGDTSIFRNMIIGFVLAVAGLIVGVVVIVASVFRVFGLGFLQGRTGAPTPMLAPGDFIGLIAGVIVGLVVLWVLVTVSAVFVRSSYQSISLKLGVVMFRTAGLLYLIGAALTIVLVGFVVIFVAQILSIVAFFSVPDQLPVAPQASSTTMNPPPTTT